MRVLAIDPGNEKSAYALFETNSSKLIEFGKLENAHVLGLVGHRHSLASHCVIEMVASYGMAVGREVFETVFWIGRFAERWEGDRMTSTPAHRMFRLQVKQHLCHDSRAKDGNIRAALIDRFGPGKDRAIGRKATPGPLFGVSSDVWSALAIAVTFTDTHAKAQEPRSEAIDERSVTREMPERAHATGATSHVPRASDVPREGAA